MQDNQLTIIIDKPLNEVFEFTTNPEHTPEWISSILAEKTDEWPPKVGTIYQNQDAEQAKRQEWSRYKVTVYKKNQEFELQSEDKNSTYCVNYKYSEIDGSTQLVYHEWVTKGELTNPFVQKTLNHLKEVIEARSSLGLR